MSSSISTTISQTFTPTITESNPTTMPTQTATPTLSSAQSIEQSLSSLSTTLSGLNETTARTVRGTHLFTKIERILNSLTKLVEAFAKLKSPEASQNGATTPTTAQPLPSGTTTPTTPTPTPLIEEQPSDLAPQIPDDPTPFVAAEIIAPQSTSVPIEAPTEADDFMDTFFNTARGPINLGSQVSRTGEFLWKPVSEKDGRLAILLPSSMTGKVSEVCVIKPDGSRALQRGQASGVGNGNREHYRFSKPGGSFPDGSIVLIKMKDGTNRHMKISETSNRVTR